MRFLVGGGAQEVGGKLQRSKSEVKLEAPIERPPSDGESGDPKNSGGKYAGIEIWLSSAYGRNKWICVAVTVNGKDGRDCASGAHGRQINSEIRKWT